MKQTILEIRDQYSALAKTLHFFEEREAELEDFWNTNPPKALVFLGCGSSYMIACSLRDIAGSMTRLPVSAMAAGDLWLNHEQYRQQLSGALVVAVSRSGHTSEILRAVDILREDGVEFRLCSLIATEKSPLAERSALPLELPWCFDESVCQTRSVSNLYAAGICLMAAFLRCREQKEQLHRLAELGSTYLEKAELFLQNAASKPWNKVVVLADGVCAGLAAEGALAFQEISQIPASQYHVLDVRHGPMVLIDRETLVLAYLYPAGKPQQEALLQDLLKKGAQVIVYSNLSREIPGTETIALETDVGSAAGGIAFLNLCQLMAYQKSLETGSDPDAPDGLDAWIQVN